MSILPLSTPFEQAMPIYLSVLFFIVFLILLRIGKHASSGEVYRNVNRIHKKIGFFYLCSASTTALILDWFGSEFLVGLAFGVYIYLSLHYAFLFPLLGICRKSISIVILEVLSDNDSVDTILDISRLREKMKKRGVGAESIYESRLEQMTLLGFAEKIGDIYQITARGRFIHRCGNIFFRVWGLRRL